MMYLAPIPKQFVDSSGVPYSDGSVEVRYHSDSELANVYLDAAGESISPNPARLDSHGAWVGYVPSGIQLDYIVKDKNGNVVFSYEKVVIKTGDGTGSEVTLAPTLETGTKIADFYIGEEHQELFAPSGGSGSGDQFVLVRSNMTTNFTNEEYQSCVNAVTNEKAVCVQFERNSRTFQAQLTQVEPETGLLVFEIDIANIHITYEVSGMNNSHTIAESDYQNGTPIFDSLQTAISWNVVLHNGDIFETNGFHASGDGGAARYKVTSSGTANGKDIIELSSGKLAVLQVNEDGSLYPEQLGYVKDLSYADRVDCTPYFNRIWSKCFIVRLHNGMYWFNDYVNLPKGAKIIGENIYTDTPTEMATYRSGDYFVYCENRENAIENVVFSNRSNNGNLPNVSTGGVGIRTNEWSGSGASHFDYKFSHIRMMGFRKGMELQGGTKWSITLNDIRFSQCYIGLEFGEASFNIECSKIYTDHCSLAGVNFHGEGVFGFYDCNFGSINTAIKVSEYPNSNYHDLLMSFFNTNFELDDQTLLNAPGIYFDIPDSFDAVLNFEGCRFMQNSGVYTSSNRCIALGKSTLVNMSGCEVRNNSGSAHSSDNFWNENRPCKFVLGAIRISNNCRGIPVPNFADSKYNLCFLFTDTDVLEIVSSGSGAPGSNLYDNSSPTVLAGFVSESSTSYPNGSFTMNNSTQMTLAIPITQYMQGQTIRISAGDSSHNSWKIGKNETLPISGTTAITFVSNSYSSGSGRDYTDISIGASETGYILVFFGSGISSTDFINDVMAAISPYYTPYEEYSGGATTYRRRVKPSLLDFEVISSSESVQIESGQFVSEKDYSLSVYVPAGKQFTGVLSIETIASPDSAAYIFDLYVPNHQKRCNYGDYSAARQGGHVIPIYYDNRNSGSRYRLWFGVTGQFNQQTLTVHVDGIAT